LYTTSTSNSNVFFYKVHAPPPLEETDRSLSALLQAATRLHPRIVLLLLSHGADPSVRTKKGDTALSLLVEGGEVECAAEVVERFGGRVEGCSRERGKVTRARLVVRMGKRRIEERERREREEQDNKGYVSWTSTDDESSKNGSEEKKSKGKKKVRRGWRGAKQRAVRTKTSNTRRGGRVPSNTP